MNEKERSLFNPSHADVDARKNYYDELRTAVSPPLTRSLKFDDVHQYLLLVLVDLPTSRPRPLFEDMYKKSFLDSLLLITTAD